MTPKRALAILIVASTAVRLLAAVSLGLGNDEAYHFLYAVHPALSYYDHPPMLAWVEMAGLALSGSWFSVLALRIGFIGLFIGSTWLMWKIASRWYGEWAGFYAALGLNLTGYYGLAASTFALPDGPLLFFWLLTILCLDRALHQEWRVLPWVWVGVAWGGALLSKYHGVFLPAGTVLYLLATPSMRHWLRRPGPYLAIGLGLLIFSPVLIWNASNGWVSFAFQGSRAVGGWTLRPDCLAVALGAQAGYFFPWIWGPLVYLLIKELRGWSKVGSDQDRLGLCLAIAPLGIFTAVACFRPVLPHWGLIGLVSLFPALGRHWVERSARGPESSRRWLTVGALVPVLLLGLTVLEYRTGWLQRAEESRWGVFSRTTDPTADLYGWDQAAERLERLGLLEDPDTFLFTRNWYQSAQVAHATRMRRRVLCYNLDDPRGFAFWGRPSDSVGKDGIFLMINDEYLPVEFFKRWFTDVIPVADFTVDRGGKPVRRIRAYRLIEQIMPFPYDFSPESLAARSAIHSTLAHERAQRSALRKDENPPLAR